MLNLDERVGIGSQPSLAEWASRALGLPEVRVQVRLRGNNLYLLCEGEPCPDVATAVPRFARAMAQNPLHNLTAPGQPRIYQVFLSGREVGHNRPDWTVRLDPNQLDRYLKPSKSSGMPQPEPPTPTSAKPTFSTYRNIAAELSYLDRSDSEGESGDFSSSFFTPLASESLSAESLANQRQARSGDPEAIARYVSESLSQLGVGVKVRITKLRNPSAEQESESLAAVLSDMPVTGEPPISQQNPPSANKAKKRLWVLCESAYSPDPSLLAEPIAQRLRSLLEKRQGESLQGFRDAVILGQVSGETKPDWMLRVDLTPPEEMLKAWAGWGDVQAIALLLNRTLAESNLAVRALLEETTLHLFCNRRVSVVSPENSEQVQTAPDRQQCVTAIASVLQALTPQGVLAATIYGLVGSINSEDSTAAVYSPPSGEETPAWIDWLSIQSGKAASALDLAKQVHPGALAFLIDRLINPYITTKLATGGIRIHVLRKGKLLHVLAEAPVCPKQSRIGPPIIKFLRQLHIPEIDAVRVYGRRAGTKQAQWRYGEELILAPLPPPITPPEFARSLGDGGDLLPQPGELIVRPEIEPIEEISGLRKLADGIVERLHQKLARSQLFVPSNTPIDRATPHGMWVGLVWGTLGVLLTVQADWAIGQFLRDAGPSNNREAELSLDSRETNIFTETAPAPQPTTLSLPFPELSLSKSKSDDESVFNVSGFTQQRGSQLTISGQCQTNGGEVDPDRCILESSSYPSFNSRQLDEQLRIYQKYLAELGTPDILIVGSSRALRGIDPATLQKALKEQGYASSKIFNFGINGATAQVVDMLVRQILKPDQLPKMIVWADGARALNGGRTDVTYNAIAASEGYKQLVAGSYPIQISDSKQATSPENSPVDSDKAFLAVGNSWASSYQEIGEWLNNKLASLSSTYPQRDRLKGLFLHQLAAIGKPPLPSNLKANKASTAANPDRMAVAGSVDSNGFLPLLVRFNPVSYYQKHPKVSGNYDADYESFQLAGRQTAALKSFMQFTRERQIPTIFINLPLTKDYLDSARAAYEEEFRQHMLRLASEEDFVYRDLSELWPDRNEYFSDPSHLNRFGAYEVSERMAKDPMIPWLSPDKVVGNQP